MKRMRRRTQEALIFIALLIVVVASLIVEGVLRFLGRVS